MNKRMFFWLTLAVFVQFLTGCATTSDAPQASVTTEKVFNKNYSIGQEMSVYVGEPVVKVKDYLLVTTEQSAMTPESECQLRSGRTLITLTPGQAYPIDFYANLHGKRHAMIQTLTGPILFDPEGHPVSDIYVRNAVGLIQHTGFTYEFNPLQCKMKRMISKKVDANALYENFEIIYNGTDGKSIFLTYREYTREDIARTAFYQNMTYDIKSGTIRFKKVKIKVKSASSESISYVVQEDGR